MAPVACKSLADIIDVICGTVDVIAVMKPVHNSKAGDEEPSREKKKDPA